jgi:hypothetical protein
LDHTPPDFAAARQAVEGISDPLTRNAANRALTEAYVGGVHRTLTDPNGPYHFSEEDANAIEASAGFGQRW